MFEIIKSLILIGLFSLSISSLFLLLKIFPKFSETLVTFSYFLFILAILLQFINIKLSFKPQNNKKIYLSPLKIAFLWILLLFGGSLITLGISKTNKMIQTNKQILERYQICKDLCVRIRQNKISEEKIEKLILELNNEFKKLTISQNKETFPFSKIYLFYSKNTKEEAKKISSLLNNLLNQQLIIKENSNLKEKEIELIL